jgi:hypothetical protein
MKFAVVSSWPNIKNAEYEIIERIKISAINIGSECVVIDNEGYLIDDKGEKNGLVDEGGIEFAIALHFTSAKMFNIYCYGAMWNPPKFLMDFGYKSQCDNLYTYDDYLIYDSNKIYDHLKNLLTQTNKDLSGCLSLMTSVPGELKRPKLLNNMKLFYSGINWERMSNSKGRHHNLLKTLDNEDLTCIYGPEEFLGTQPWKGFKTYAGSLPFDGISTMQAINECGISLVLTSNVHRKAKAVSSRLFESCAAGAILICDDNKFIEQEFGDSVLYISYDELNFQNNVEQIKKHLEWIENNKDKALDLAKRSQRIFQEKFHLDKVLGEIIKKHPERKMKVIKDSCDTDTGVSVIVRCYKNSTNFISTIVSLNGQYNKKSIDLIVVCDINDKILINKSVKKYLNSDIKCKIISLNIFDNKQRIMTTGSILVEALQQTKYRYTAVLDAGSVLFNDHLSLLLKKINNKSTSLVYSYATYIETNEDGLVKKKNENFINYNIKDIFEFRVGLNITSMMFDKDAVSNYFEHLRLLDGREANSIAVASFLCGKWDTSFKNTYAISSNNNIESNSNSPLLAEDDWQIQYVKDVFGLNPALYGHLINLGKETNLGSLSSDQFEIILKTYFRNKFGSKYPKITQIIKRIYNNISK